MTKWKVTYILILTLCGLLYLYRESINTYWIQTYHKESPLVALEYLGYEILGNSKAGDENQTAEVYVEDSKSHVNRDNAEISDDKSVSEDGTKAPVDVMDDIESLLSLGTEEAVDSADDANQDDHQYATINENGSAATIPALELGSIAGLDLESEQFVGPTIPQLPDTAYLKAGDKIFFVGDSMMQGVAPRVRQLLYKSENIDGVDLSKQSTGLAYPSFYNWPKVVEDTLKTDGAIRAIIVYLGANDPWDFPNPAGKGKRYLKFKSPEWERAYRERIQKILLSAVKYDLPVIWLGAPCMRKTDLHNGMVYLNKLYQSEVERFNGRYITTSDVLGCSDDGYIAYAETDKGNQKVRTNDGIHFTVTGQRLIADKIVHNLVIEKAPEPEITIEADEEADGKSDGKPDAESDAESATAQPSVKKSDETLKQPIKSASLNKVNQSDSQTEIVNPQDRIEYDISLQGKDQPQSTMIPTIEATKQNEK